MIRVFVIVINIFVCGYLYGKPKGISIDDVRDMSFKECLDINYLKLGLYKGHYSDLNDRSYLLKWYAIDNDSIKKSNNLKEFIEIEAGGFYLAKTSIKRN